jgi:hypothetical protein
MQDGPCRAPPEQGPLPRAELLRVLMLHDFERADRIGEFWSYPTEPYLRRAPDRLEEERTLRAVLVGMLAEMKRKAGPV